MRRDINRIIEGRYRNRGKRSSSGGGGGLLEYLRDTYAPLILLGFDVDGSDSSGNEHDFTIENNAAVQAGTLDLLSGWGPNVLDVPADNGSFDAASISPYPASGPSHTFIIPFKRDGGTSTGFMLSVGTNLPTINYSSNLIGYTYSASSGRTARSISDGSEALHIVVVRNSDNEVDFYENGVLYSTKSITATNTTSGSSDGALSHISTGAAGSYAPGEYAGFVHVDSVLTAAEVYDIAQQGGGVVPSTGHYYKEVIEANGLDTSCVFHAPLWDTAGAQAIDVSGNENHGTYTGGPTLMQTANNSMAVYSVEGNGTTQYIVADDAIVDYSTDDVTIAVSYNAQAASGLDGIFALSSSSTHYIATFTNGTDLLVRVYDGTVLKTHTIANAGNGTGWHNLVVRWDASALTLDVWVDGVQETTLTATGLSPTTPTALQFMRAPNVIGVGTLDGLIELPTVFNTALSEAGVAVLNGTSFTPWYQTILSNYGTNLVATYDFAEDPSGGTLTDRSGNDFDATWSGSPVQISGSDQSITAVNLPNAADHAQTPSDVYGVNLSTDSFTWHVRFRTDSTAGSLVGFFAYHRASSEYALLSLQNGQARFQLSSADTAQGSTDLRDGEWHDIVCKYDQSEDAIRLWVDGAYIDEDTSISTSFTDATATLEGELGRVAIFGVSDYIGDFDAFDVWDAALSDLDCHTVANQGVAPRATTVADLTASENTIEAFNSPTDDYYIIYPYCNADGTALTDYTGATDFEYYQLYIYADRAVPGTYTPATAFSAGVTVVQFESGYHNDDDTFASGDYALLFETGTVEIVSTPDPAGLGSFEVVFHDCVFQKYDYATETTPLGEFVVLDGTYTGSIATDNR